MTSAPKSFPESPLITNIAAARAVSRILFPTDDRINGRIDQRSAFWQAQLGLDRPRLSAAERERKELLLRVVDAGILFMANMAARYASNWSAFDWDAWADLDARVAAAGFAREAGGVKKLYLAYHQAEHPMWMVDRLIEVYRAYQFPFERCAVLSMSVGPHDLEQLLPGVRDDGIGWSEWRSASEACRIMEGAGFERERDRDFFERVSSNIYGTSFSFDPKVGYLGAAAPTLVPRIHAKHPGREASAEVREQVEDLLLTADVDTATVTDFAEYTSTAVHLCRESLLARQGHERCPPAPTLAFLTKAQRRFWELQCFNSRCGKELFQPRKERNVPLMEELLAWVEARFTSPAPGVVLDHAGRRIEDGEPIAEAFAAKASELVAASRPRA